jgi:predicted small secreted protein
MYKKASWIVLTLLIALSMILAACAPTAAPKRLL